MPNSRLYSYEGYGYSCECCTRGKRVRQIGVNVGDATMDWDTVAKRTWHMIDKSAGIYDYYNAYDNVDVYRGAASFRVR